MSLAEFQHSYMASCASFFLVNRVAVSDPIQLAIDNESHHLSFNTLLMLMLPNPRVESPLLGSMSRLRIARERIAKETRSPSIPAYDIDQIILALQPC